MVEDINDNVTAEEQLNIENVSDETLLNVVLSKLNYTMVKDVLVKPLEAIKVKRMTNVPEKTDELDEEGQPIMTMVKKEVEVDSTFRSGIVLALPTQGASGDIKVGDKVVYPHKYSIDFDLFMDSVLVKPYDIIATVA